MRAMILASLVAVAGCGSGSLVVVTVDATPALAGVASLRNTAMAGGRSHVFSIPVGSGAIPPKRVYGIDVPPDVTGTFSITVDALDAGGRKLATRSGSTTLKAGARADIAITFGATAVADMAAGAGDLAKPSDLAMPRDLAMPDLMPPIQDLAPYVASFTFTVGGVQQTPLNCTTSNWEYNAPGPIGDMGLPVLLKNTGPVPIAYNARPGWNLGTHYQPGVAVGDNMEVVGVLNPNEQVDFRSVYAGNVTALVGSQGVFSFRSVMDEATIPWPNGVAGSGGSTTMHLAEIEVRSSCQAVVQVW